VAAELIGSADRAARRGGVAAAAAFWERAVALTPDPGQRAKRALAAAEAKYTAGDLVATEKLLAAAEAAPLDELGHARVERMHAQIAFGLNRGGEAPSLLLQAAQRLRRVAADQAWDTYLEALVAGIYAGRRAVGAGLSEVARAALSAPLGPEPLPHPQLLLRGLAVRVLDGYVAAAPLLKEALRQYRAQPQRLDALCHPYNLVAIELWDHEAWFELASGQVQLARVSGTLGWLPFALAHLAMFHVQSGELAQAAALMAELASIAPGTPEPDSYCAVMLAVWRGDATRASELMDKMTVSAATRGEGEALAFMDTMKAALYNG
jgi:hypothetical protein